MKTLIILILFIIHFQTLADIGPDGKRYGTCYNSTYADSNETQVQLKVCNSASDDSFIYFRGSQIINPEAEGLRVFRQLEGGSVTRMATGCSDVQVKQLDKEGNVKGDINLYMCSFVNPLRDEMSVNPSDYTFYLDEGLTKPISNSLVTFKEGTYYLNTTIPKVELAGVGDSYNCNPANAMTTNQCLVCNCFHEARGTSTSEMYAVNRVVHSRVLNPIFPMFDPIVSLHPQTAANEACQVVYDRNAFTWAKHSSKRNQQIGEAELPASDIPSYRLCMSQVKASLSVKDDYFASYYMNENVYKPISQKEGAPTLPKWYRDCKSDNPASVISKVPNVLDASLSVNTVHTYVSFCEPREKRFLIESGQGVSVQGVVD